MLVLEIGNFKIKLKLPGIYKISGGTSKYFHINKLMKYVGFITVIVL